VENDVSKLASFNPKRLKLKGKALREQKIGNTGNCLPGYAMQRSECQGWYSPSLTSIPDEADAAT
jgi:hypothetical protein